MDMYDKIVNHLVSEYILLSSIIPVLIDSNVISKKGKGTSYEVKLYYKYRTKIYKSNENINFIEVRKNKKYSNISRTKKKYKRKLKEYDEGLVSLNSLISSNKNYNNRRVGAKVWKRDTIYILVW